MVLGAKSAGIAFKNMAVVNISHLLKTVIDLCVLNFVPNEVYMSVKLMQPVKCSC